MGKTFFQEFGTVVTAKFLNGLFGQGKDGGHKHDGLDEDGHCGLIDREQVSPDIISGMALMGQIVAYAGSVTPDGWLICNGNPVPDSERFDAFRNWIGSNASYLVEQVMGGVVYRTPNLSGRVIVGVGNGNDSIDNKKSFSLGETGGEYEHTLTIQELATHKHQISGEWGGNGSGSTVQIESGNNNGIETKPTDFDLRNSDNDIVGGDNPHNNIQPYAVVNYIIRAV